ncbi:hypothetical protein RJ639_038130 [Escallonia herrerae]|uniref:Glycosyltransferase 61 catalytic domain-containing protein n=1 Tax=Escallonia herrerae TaxID=1293975 RepID=A0AA89BFF6_9ASTE|nr:hypothetical protein RJ639_038130 [Escallonia herrerae]
MPQAGEYRNQLEATGFVCHSDLHSDICVANEETRFDTKALAMYLPSSRRMPQVRRTIQPYARKEDETAMKLVTPAKILRGNIAPPSCNYNYDVPAVLFSSGGFTGNLFHEFNEVIIPLFITCHHFKSQLRFIVTDFKPWFVKKYDRILSHLSRYEVINPASNGSTVHCFPGAVVGLTYHDNLAMNSTHLPEGSSMHEFKQFLRESYNLNLKHAAQIKRPVLVLISRRKTRVFLNEAEMVGMMEELGFQVVGATPKRMSNLDEFSNVVNSCNVMVGAHGAGLTNALFLPEGAVMVQVVPLGLNWASNVYFGEPSHEMGVQYLEYKIEPKESSLFELYGPDHPVVADPASIFSKGYQAARAMYVDGQNVKINTLRFRETLNEALRLLGHSTRPS